ncbi:MAG: DUF4143 domain-containing protein [Bacteroidales bacterium]|nr:DUF4143 domain-containing protein [Bacteroidales bacterium]MDD3908289.1 DUF4143 domain-containing protein [Bacteroidales bacterium]
MDIKNYKSRIIDAKIASLLEAFGAVCIEGPKWCGKTWTAIRHSHSQVFLGDPSGNFQNRQLAQINPELVLTGDYPHLVDEWQEVPAIWDAVRYKVDLLAQKGLFILTGSATPNHKGVLHSGTGRIVRVSMSPMSLYESGDSNGKVSLMDLFNGVQQDVLTGNVDLMHLINLTIRGGWPAAIGVPDDVAFELPKSYIDAVVQDDVYRVDGVKRDKHKMNLLLRSLARNESTTATNKKLKDDIKDIDNQDVDIDTIAEYLNVFGRLFILDNQLPFSPNIRSSVRVKQSEKRHFVDPSLACAVLGASSSMLINDLQTYGFLFESLCERDLKIYALALGGQLFHYQDYNNFEIDAVVQLSDGRWGAFEIKLGMNQVDDAAQKLLRICESAKNKQAAEPTFLCVICGMSNAAYKRPDGVYVVPITALKN